MKNSLPIVAACSAFLALAALAGCGAKGPLFLPNNPPPTKQIGLAPNGAAADLAKAAKNLRNTPSTVAAPAAASVVAPAAATITPPAAATVTSPAGSQATP